MQVHDTKSGPLRNSRQASAYCKVNLSSHPTAEPRGLELNSGGVWRGKWLMESAGDAENPFFCAHSTIRKTAESMLFFFLTSYRVKSNLVSYSFVSAEAECCTLETLSFPSSFPLPPPPLSPQAFGCSRPPEVCPGSSEGVSGQFSNRFLHHSRSRVA